MAGENSTTEPPMHVQCNLWGVFPSQKNSRELNGSSPKNTNATLRIWSTHKTEKKLASPSGNRNPVSRVTSGDTHHYTNEDTYTINWSSFHVQIFVHLVTYQWQDSQPPAGHRCGATDKKSLASLSGRLNSVSGRQVVIFHHYANKNTWSLFLPLYSFPFFFFPLSRNFPISMPF